MTVLQLVKYSARDTIEALRVLLAMALRGELRGLALCYRRADGTEESVFTGAYKSNPASAINASLRLSVTLMQANGEMDS
jgi:hypothetical protein